jgi:hypothetical protein
VLPDKKDWRYPIPPRGNGRLIFVRKKDDNVNGIRFPAKEKKELARRIEAYLNATAPRLDKNECFIDAELHRVPGLIARGR